jgi:putative peptidoglycan lipid II flippase
VFGSGLVQLGLFADTIIASFLPAGAISYLYYADRLNQLPLGVIGIAIGTVLLPDLARRVAAGQVEAALQAQARALASSLALTLPCAVALGLLAEPLMVGLFVRGAFNRADAHGSAQALMAYALGLPAFVLVRSLTPGFQARGDTRTPVKLAFAATGLNIALKLLLIGPLSHVGVALATSLSSWLNVALLSTVLARRGWLALGDAKSMMRRCALAGFIMAAGIVALRIVEPRVWAPLASTKIALLEVFGFGGLGFLAYALVVAAGRSHQVADLLRLRRLS